MLYFSFFFLLIAHLLNAEVILQRAYPSELQDDMISFCTGHLLQAGIFDDEKKAQEATTIEWNQEQRDTTKEFFYYHLISQEGTTRYGYFIYSTKEGVAFLYAIYLEEIFRGRGLGRQILENFETTLKEIDIETIKLYVYAHNINAFELYKKMGYEIENTYFLGGAPVGYHLKKDL